ncbi:MAG: hypothetical protein IJS15_04190 [Victivallales bacterium]|nr:hypothetical protein [Victivallales bacterium]
MNSSEKAKCHAIIHGFAVACGLGNAVPTLGVGIGVDIAGMAGMCMSLAAVFCGDPNGAVAEGMLLTVIKRTFTKQALKAIAKETGKKKAAKELAKLLAKQIVKRTAVKCAAKEAGKLIPVIGSIIASTLSVTMIEAEGWRLAKEMDDARGEVAA